IRPLHSFPTRRSSDLADGFIFLGSKGAVQVDQIKAGTAGNNPPGADVRLKAQGQITNIDAVGTLNVEGRSLVLEAGQAAIGTARSEEHTSELQSLAYL